MLRAFTLTLLLGLTSLAFAGGGKDLKPYNGAELPDFTLNDLSGKPHQLSSYRGKVVMLNFWATYCGPCIKEIPSMQRLQEKMGSDFVILAVNMGETKEDVDAFMSKHKIDVTFPLLLDSDAQVLTQWMVTAVPTTFMLDKQGKIRYSLFGGLEWDNDNVQSVVEKLLAEK